MVAIPDELLRRSAEARAKADGRTAEDVLAEWRGEAPAAAAPEVEAPAAAAPPAETPPAATPAAAAPAASVDDLLAKAAADQGLPAKLVRRSAEAKAKATGTSLEAVLAEMAGEPVPGPTPAAEAPTAAASAPAAAPAASVDDLLAKAAADQGLPAKLVRRSAEAKAKATGTSLEAVLAEMAGEPPPTEAAPAAAPAATPAAAAPAAAPAGVPESARTQRLLTVVKAKAIQQVRREPTDKVNVWPHLLAIEFVALLVVLGGLIVFSIFQDAPLLELANPNEQPNPSKAPWYFLGLQELLSYFDPQIAGVLIPGMGLAALAIIPYIDRNPATRPSERKYAIMLFTFFVVAAAILTIIGSFFRGPGFNFTFPWRDGIFFDL